MSLLFAFSFCVGLNLLMFLPAFIFKTDKLTDISYAVTFFLASFIALLCQPFSFSSLLLFLMIFIWALRLGAYLLYRIHKIGHDKRFDGMRESFLNFGRFWILQGLTVWVVLIPSFFYFGSQEKFSLLSLPGLILWFLGFVIETKADSQKFKFKISSKNNWIESGLWKYSRHPNYLGEMMIWFGIYLFVLPSLSYTQNLIGIVSPLSISLLLIFGSGVPILEKSADDRFRLNPAYAKYKSKTGIVWPKNWKGFFVSIFKTL